MKKLTILFVLAFILTAVHAQNDGVAPLAKGEKQLNFGTGFSSNGLPVYVSMDFAVHKDVTVTPVVNMKFGDNIKGGFLVAGDYHWNYLIGIPSNWDFYAGAHLGFDFGDAFDPNIGVHVGGRWYWSEKWGLHAEIGGGTGYGTTVGLSMKL